MKPLPDPRAEGGPCDALIFEKTHITQVHGVHSHCKVDLVGYPQKN